MHDFVIDLRNLYSAAEAASCKFPKGRVSLIKCMRDANPGVDNNGTLWSWFYESRQQVGNGIKCKGN